MTALNARIPLSVDPAHQPLTRVANLNTAVTPDPDHSADDERPEIHEPRLWQSGDWTAKVIKNENDEGWAVAMYKLGKSEPALIGPWTMGRDKKNPKPLDGNAFITLVKTASEFVRRSEQQLHASLHQKLVVSSAHGRVTVALDINPDDDEPSAELTAWSDDDELLAKLSVSPGFKLNRASAERWVENDFARPAGS